jgi:DNA-binding response OmpR family regulator
MRAEERRYGAMTASKTTLRVLVVEDDPPTLRALQMYLESYGHAVASALDMANAVKLAHEVEFDVLLTDLNLPDGTGWEVVEKVATIKPVRAIAFSGFGQDSDFARSREVGILEHLLKPVGSEELLAAIERVMQVKAAALPQPRQ